MYSPLVRNSAGDARVREWNLADCASCPGEISLSNEPPIMNNDIDGLMSIQASPNRVGLLCPSWPEAAIAQTGGFTIRRSHAGINDR